MKGHEVVEFAKLNTIYHLLVSKLLDLFLFIGETHNLKKIMIIIRTI